MPAPLTVARAIAATFCGNLQTGDRHNTNKTSRVSTDTHNAIAYQSVLNGVEEIMRKQASSYMSGKSIHGPQCSHFSGLVRLCWPWQLRRMMITMSTSASCVVAQGAQDETNKDV